MHTQNENNNKMLALITIGISEYLNWNPFCLTFGLLIAAFPNVVVLMVVLEGAHFSMRAFSSSVGRNCVRAKFINRFVEMSKHLIFQRKARIICRRIHGENKNGKHFFFAHKQHKERRKGNTKTTMHKIRKERGLKDFAD